MVARVFFFHELGHLTMVFWRVGMEGWGQGASGSMGQILYYKCLWLTKKHIMSQAFGKRWVIKGKCYDIIIYTPQSDFRLNPAWPIARQVLSPILEKHSFIYSLIWPICFIENKNILYFPEEIAQLQRWLIRLVYLRTDLLCPQAQRTACQLENTSFEKSPRAFATSTVAGMNSRTFREFPTWITR